MAFVFFALLCLLYCVNSQSQPNPSPSAGCGIQSQGSGTFFENYGGYNRQYVVYQSSGYNQNVAIPLVFAFHGYTGTASGMKNGWNGDTGTGSATDRNYLSVYVQSTNAVNINSWNDIGCSQSPGSEGPTCNYSTVQDVAIPSNCPPDQGPNQGDGYCNWCNCNANDIDWINALAIIIENNYCIDMSREYALGYSQGGMMAHRVGCDLNGRFAAIAPFHGQQQLGFNCESFVSDVQIGIFNVWGTSDSVVCGETPAVGNTDACQSYDGYWYTKVSAVQQRFATHNGCSNINNGPVTITTQSDGIRDWQCTGYNTNCNNGFYVMQCNWNGGHTYPNTLTPPRYNFGLAAVIDYFYQFQRTDSERLKFIQMYNATRKYRKVFNVSL